jgi:cation transporter-like permease
VKSGDYTDYRNGEVMDEVKAPSMLVAVLFTISAVFSLMSFVLKAAGGGGGGLVIFMLFTAGLLVFCAIANWVVYFKKYVNFKIEKQIKEKE